MKNDLNTILYRGKSKDMKVKINNLVGQL